MHLKCRVHDLALTACLDDLQEVGSVISMESNNFDEDLEMLTERWFVRSSFDHKHTQKYTHTKTRLRKEREWGGRWVGNIFLSHLFIQFQRRWQKSLLDEIDKTISFLSEFQLIFCPAVSVVSIFLTWYFFLEKSGLKKVNHVKHSTNVLF